MNNASTNVGEQVSGSQLSVFMDFPVLDISYKWNHTICGPLRQASFTYDVFKAYPCCNMYQYFIFIAE